MRVSALLMATFLSFSAAAGPMSYTEPFAPPQPEDESVVKLEQVEYVENANTVRYYFPEQPAFALVNSDLRSGRVRYQVRGADAVTIGFYSPRGSYLILQNGKWDHGVVIPDSEIEKLKRAPIVMDEEGILFSRIDDKWHRQVYDDYGASKFVEHVGPKGSIKNLHLSVIAVDASGNHQMIDTWTTDRFEILQSPMSQTVLTYFEERHYTIPTGTRELIIELNAPWTRINTSGEHISTYPTQYPVLLTSLRIDGGADLSVGEKELPTPGDESGDDNGEEKIPLPTDSGDDDDEIVWIFGDRWDFSDPIFEEMLTQNEELMELVQEQQTDINKLQREKEEAEEKTKSSSSKSTATKSSSSSKSASSTSKNTTSSKSSSTTRTTVAEKIDTSDGEGDEGTDVTHTREMIYSERGGFDSSRVYDVMLGICIAFGGLAAYRVYIGSVRK